MRRTTATAPVDAPAVHRQAKHPRTAHGAHDASRDPEVLRGWWKCWPSANIGITLDKLAVVDVDPRNGGDVDMLPARLPDTCFAKTGGGGWHYLYRAREGVSYASSLGAGIDIKHGPGAYIVAEPSIHATGQRYTWCDESECWALEPAEAPAWLERLNGAPVSVAGSLSTAGERHIPEGRRNAHLTSLAGSMRRRNMCAEAITAALMAENMARCTPPLAETEVKGIVQSVMRYPAPAVKDDAPFSIVSHHEFITGLRPPNWIVNRVLQRGYLYALTAYWGHGKTALMLTIALCCAAGRKVGTLQVERCKVLYLCGENVDDVRLRVRAVADVLNIRADELDEHLYFTQIPFALEDPASRERCIVAALPHAPYGLIVVDTGPAHSDAEEENANRQMHELATAMRTLAHGIGDACVVALMHPAKGATKETMQPRGGGAFSGAIDGELVAWKDDASPIVEFFHRAKFRGPGFTPMNFELKTFTMPALLDNFGQQAHTVAAVAIDESDRDRIEKEDWQAQNRVLYAMYTQPYGSMSEWARACCWFDKKGDPEKWRVQRSLKALTGHKLVKQTRSGRYVLTDNGKKEAAKAGRI